MDARESPSRDVGERVGGELHPRAEIHPKAHEFQDLCTTCNHMEVCLSKKTLRRPIHFCEEFEAYGPTPDAPTPAQEPVAPVNADPGKYMGICVNCDHREDCRHACTEGGIWHCEEYR